MRPVFCNGSPRGVKQDFQINPIPCLQLFLTKDDITNNFTLELSANYSSTMPANAPK